MHRRVAIPIEAPAVRAGQPRCPCCDGPLGPKSWEIPVCITCWEAQEGRRTDPRIFQAQGTRAGTWQTVTFARKHTRCPLRVDNGGEPGRMPGQGLD